LPPRVTEASYVDQGIWIWNTAGFAAETFRKAQPAELRELAGVLVQQASWGADRLDVTFKPPFDVILREVRKSALRVRSLPRKQLSGGAQSTLLEPS
jgi:hypothetical protein